MSKQLASSKRSPEPRTARKPPFCAPLAPKKSARSFVDDMIDVAEDAIADPDTQPIEPTVLFSDIDAAAEEYLKTTDDIGFPLSLKPVDESLGPFTVINLSWVTTIPEDGPDVIGMGSWTDENGASWAVLVTDLWKTTDPALPDYRVLYKLFNRTAAIQSKAAWMERQGFGVKQKQVTYKRKR